MANSGKKRFPERQLLVDRIVRKIKNRIAHGEYLPGRLLPSERELAAELDVSRTTVSAALSSLAQEGLIEQTRGRGTVVVPVQQRLGHTQIAVVHKFELPRLPAQETQILHGIQDTLSRLGYSYDVVPVAQDWHALSDLSERILPKSDVHTLAGRYGALVFVETLHAADQIRSLEEQRIPLVVANLEEDIEVSATWVDHRKIIRSAVDILVAFGHRRIAYLGTDPSLFFYGKAQEGYLTGLDAAGIPRDESLMALCERTDALRGYLAIKPLLREAPPTAVVAARDILAEGACQAAEEAGLLVGKDISIIGFDDITWHTENPFLTTFREPAYEMGAVAAEMLSERMVHGWQPPEKRELEAPLILRQSVGPPPMSEAGLHSTKEVTLKRAGTGTANC